METLFYVCTLSVWHAREGGSIRTHEFESIHGRKTRGTYFTRTQMGQWADQKCGSGVVLPHDPWILPSQSLKGPVSGMGFRIGPLLDTLNYAQEKFLAHTLAFFLHQHASSPPPCPRIARTL